MASSKWTEEQVGHIPKLLGSKHAHATIEFEETEHCATQTSDVRAHHQRSRRRDQSQTFTESSWIASKRCPGPPSTLWSISDIFCMIFRSLCQILATHTHNTDKLGLRWTWNLNRLKFHLKNSCRETKLNCEIQIVTKFEAFQSSTLDHWSLSDRFYQKNVPKVCFELRCVSDFSSPKSPVKNSYQEHQNPTAVFYHNILSFF